MSIGFLNINKPLHVTSNKVTTFIKKVLSEKIGHIGTLDPLASGVLPIAIGKATKLIQEIEDAPKSYTFCIQFGQKTSTSDAEGEVIDTCSKKVQEDECKNVIKYFKGFITQRPSIFSAIKINGKRAYSLARQNKINFVPKLRKVQIFNLEFSSYDANLNQAKYTVECSKGTYIRSLAEDISCKMNTLGFIKELIRIKSCNMSIQNSICFNKILSLNTDQSRQYLEQNILTPEELIYNLKIYVNEKEKKMIINGLGIGVSAEQEYNQDENVFAYFKNEIIAIGSIINNNTFKPKKILINTCL